MTGKMRLMGVIGLSLAALLVWLPSSASATSSIALVWDDGGNNSPSITPTQTSVEQLNIMATADADGISAIFFTFAFDTDLENELDIATVTFGAGEQRLGGLEQEAFGFAPGVQGYGGVTQGVAEESSGSQQGLLGSYDIVAVGGGFQNKTKVFGSAFFTVRATTAVNDANDIDVMPMILDNQFDDIIDSNGSVISDTVNLIGAAVVPEPISGALALVALGSLGTLAALRRR